MKIEYDELKDFKLDPKNPPEGGHSYVLVSMIIKKVATNEIRQYETFGLFADNEYFSTFNYEDGNDSCDCNRELYFERVNDVPYYEDRACSDGKFLINIINPETGHYQYSEFEVND